MKSERFQLAVALALSGLLWPGSTGAEQPKPKAGERPLTQADYARLQSQITELRQLLVQLVRAEQQHVEALSRIIGDSKLTAGLETAEPAAASAVPPSKPSPAEPDKPVRASRSAGRAGVRPLAPISKGTIVGKVTIPGGAASAAAVFVEDVPGHAGASVEMKQLNKQFVPDTLVVTRGTRITFPNLDPIFHNVFSLTPGNTFDLGNYRKGDEPKAVVMTKPGVVNVYCNMHPQMVGYILVVPGPLHTRTDKEGHFQIAGVPSGRRRVAAWIANADPVIEEVEVSSGEVVSVDFALTPKKPGAHTRKTGAPYGSYDE
ncbi:MAG TPA: carboxypeptidase regulatory-like domain-containing protein [Polyangia bacterium]|nr:carboxypeptidase regulatory-like domain-containing protein [Polyangia bacterium]